MPSLPPVPTFSAALPPSTAFFADLKEKQVEVIMAAASRKRVAANERLYQAGEKADRLFLLSAGSVKYYKITKRGEEVLLSWLSPGDVFGLAALFLPPSPYIGIAETVQDSELYVWQQDILQQLVRDYPQIVKNSLRVVLHYLAVSADHLVGLITETAEQRLARTLLHLGDETGSTHADGVEVDVTNQHLGALAHVSPFTTSRLLKKWERLGRVEKKRGKVLIHSPEKLVMD